MTRLRNWLWAHFNNGTRGLMLAVVVLLGAVGFAAFSEANHAAPLADPLGDYDTQIVHNRIEGINGPAVVEGGVLFVTGTKCNATDAPVMVRVDRSWVRVDVGERIQVVFNGPGVRQPGCPTGDFENLLPPEIVPGVWYQTATDVPIVDGLDGVPRTWVTQNFTVVARDGSSGA